jgi:hypothetical protein
MNLALGSGVFTAEQLYLTSYISTDWHRQCGWLGRVGSLSVVYFQGINPCSRRSFITESSNAFAP